MPNDFRWYNNLFPSFEKNYRPNHYLSKKISQLTLNDLSKDEILLDEAYLTQLTDKNEIDKFITTALINDAHFFNFKLKDKIFGNIWQTYFCFQLFFLFFGIFFYFYFKL